MEQAARRGAWVSAACVVIAVVLGCVLPVGAAGRSASCFGAAARDTDEPCDSRAQRFRVTPSTRDAQLQPNSRCALVKAKGPPNRVCSFGLSADRAVKTVALLGDSHAPSWRAALSVLVRRQHWRGLTVRRSSCPFTTARRSIGTASSDACSAWMRSVLRWFGDHPEIDTVFLVNSADYAYLPGPEDDPHAAAVDGYRQALDALPSTVRRIVVIRDNPIARETTLDCVHRAHARHRRADVRCAIGRSQALLPDAATDAAEDLDGDRGRTLDLTRYFCSPSRCFTVIAGALVYKDRSHITATFSHTLGPYLLRAYRSLVRADTRAKAPAPAQVQAGAAAVSAVPSTASSRFSRAWAP